MLSLKYPSGEQRKHAKKTDRGVVAKKSRVDVPLVAALRDPDVFFCIQNKNNMLWFYPQLASARGALNAATQHGRFACNWPPIPNVFNGLFPRRICLVNANDLGNI